MNENLKILEPGEIDVKGELPKELYQPFKLNIVDLIVNAVPKVRRSRGPLGVVEKRESQLW